MPDTFTSTYNFTKPEVNASRDTWGTKQNANLDTLDGILAGLNTSKAPLASPTFTGTPTLAGAALATQAWVTSAITAAISAAVPIGLIAKWGSATPPTGWALCNGATVNGVVTPDLRDRFIVGAGTTYSYGSTGGAVSVTPTGTVGGTALTIAQLPAHQHSNTLSVTVSGSLNDLYETANIGATNAPSAGYAGGAAFNYVYSLNALSTPNSMTSTGTASGLSAATGSGSTHTHPLTMDALNIRPPYYGLYFIIRVV